MADTIDTLIVEMVLNSSQFLAGLQKADKALSGIRSAVKVTGLALSAMFIKSGIAEFLDQAQQLGNLSRSVRESAEDLQVWGEAVKREGGTVDGFNSTVKKLSDDLMSIPLTGGNSPLLGGLTRLGVQFRNLDGSMRKPLDLLKDLSSRFQGMSQAQSLALGKKLGLDEPTIRLLQRGRRGLDELLNKYRELGVMSEKDIKTGERLKRMFQDYQQVITALGLRFIRFFLPAAEKVSEWLMSFARYVQQNSRSIESAIITISGAIALHMAPALWKLISNPVIVGLTALAAAIFLVIEDFMAWKQGADNALGPVYEALKKIGDWISQNIGWFNLLGTILLSLFAADMGRFISGLHSVTDAFTAQHGIASKLLAVIDAIYLAYKAGEWIAEKVFEPSKGTRDFSKLTDEEKNAIIYKARFGEDLANISTNTQAIDAQRYMTSTQTNNNKTQNVNIDRINITSNATSMPQLIDNIGQTPIMQSTTYQGDRWGGG